MYIIETGVPQRKSASYAPGRAPRAKLVPLASFTLATALADYASDALRPNQNPHDWVVVDGWVPRDH